MTIPRVVLPNKEMLIIKKEAARQPVCFVLCLKPTPPFLLSLHFSNPGDQGSVKKNLPTCYAPWVFRVLAYAQSPGDFSKSMLAFLRISE